MSRRRAPCSGIILAGGGGTRLRSLTQRIAGDGRPKQFCRLLGDETLLEQTYRRAGLLVSRESTVTVVTRAHEPYYEPALSGVPRQTIVIQPENRGTAPAVAYGLRCLEGLAAPGPVVLLPSDHYVSDDFAFAARVEEALEVVRARPELVVLLGIAADRPEVEYGWIEPGEPIRGPWLPVYRVRRFWEKPARRVAERLLAAGCLWNSFVIAAWPTTLYTVIRSALPTLASALEPLRGPFNPSREVDLARAIYSVLPSTDFSGHVLRAHPENLAVLPISGLEWSDLGDPARVEAVQQRFLGDVVPA